MKTKLTFRNAFLIFIEIIMITIFYGGVVFGCGLIYLMELLGYELPPIETRQIILLALVITTGIAFSYYRYKQFRKLESWSLDGSILRRGVPANYELDLSSVEKAIWGFPKSRWHNFFYGGKYRLSEQAYIDSIYSCTLILKLGPTTYLPLYLFEYGGGLEIMNEIAQLLSSKFDENYEFSDIEKKTLKIRKRNKPCRSS
jgi:hypothetical protein